jgi:hypothetical protein
MRKGIGGADGSGRAHARTKGGGKRKKDESEELKKAYV